MRKLLQHVSARIEAFVEQRDDVVLVLGAETADAVPLLAMLEGIEANRGSDFFWTHTDPYSEPRAYASSIVDTFSAKHGAVRLAMEKEGMTPWPALPSKVSDGSAPPALRLRELVAFSRELFPIPNAGVSVWTFFPLEISDPNGFARLMQELTAHEFPFPWCHHLRFIIRDDPKQRALDRAFARAPRVQRYTPDLSASALNKSLEEEVADESLPLAERMASLLVSAGNDLAFERFDASLDKFALLLKYHGSMGNHAMAAASLDGMGQVYVRKGDLASAEQAFHAALAPASHGEHPPIPVLTSVVLGLADLRTRQERWEEAEGYWDVAHQLATAGRDAPLKIRALDQRGLSQLRQGKHDLAEQSWHAGSVIAAQLEDKNLCADLLERLHGLYAARGPAARQREVREQLAALGRRVGG